MPDLYYIISIKNFTSVLNEKALLCDTLVKQRGLERASIAHAHIKARRAATRVPLPPFGCLADYVPFYFAPRSPMLYAIHKKSVKGFSDPESTLIYLVTSTEIISQQQLNFVFTDGHGTMKMSKFYKDIYDLNNIDWKIMEEKYWRDTDEDPDRSRRREAEFLVYQRCPMECMTKAVVYDKTMQSMVINLLREHQYGTDVQINPAWYY